MVPVGLEPQCQRPQRQRPFCHRLELYSCDRASGRSLLEGIQHRFHSACWPMRRQAKKDAGGVQARSNLLVIASTSQVLAACQFCTFPARQPPAMSRWGRDQHQLESPASRARSFLGGLAVSLGPARDCCRPGCTRTIQPSCGWVHIHKHTLRAIRSRIWVATCGTMLQRCYNDCTMLRRLQS